ncbi:hypothetical protein AWH56_009040 [Anaerobacillus isosaccharinicus]|uniref:Uncharacterized protein n=1 Tax=Anaerobacillus isosaccharinicus TaxID=1532552 RepID=A0A1S2MDC0_9BACI|nr:hypothetical protein [Anaerobacillus isosaccharinicus]MBA5588897.1 hypothetical protein [Anaerobacillus isosaccharinicus]QOY37707.1 hypothetical protein AWH56_009040 [Anaerobacillus isosaccharinicus]
MKKDFWLIVFNRKTGAFENAAMVGSPVDTIDSIKDKFLITYGEHYLTIEIGEGTERPEGLSLLPFVD